MPSFDDGGQTSTAGDGTALRAHAVPVATRTHDRRRAHQGDEVARLRHRRAGVETGVGCAALGTATGQGSPAGPRPVGPGYVPRGTEYRIYHRVTALRAAVKPL